MQSNAALRSPTCSVQRKQCPIARDWWILLSGQRIMLQNLSDGQVNFFEDFKLEKNCEISLLVKTFLGLVERMFGLVNVSFSLSEWKTVKRTFFAPCTCYRQFALIQRKESPYICSKFNPLNMDRPLIRTLSMAPLVLQIFQLKVGRPCNVDATQISLFLNVASSIVQ